MLYDFDVPNYDAPLENFTLAPELREKAVKAAQDVFQNTDDDQEKIRALKIIEANGTSAEQRGAVILRRKIR